MTVIVHLRVPADAFELGRILRRAGDAAVALETMVPLGELAVPFFWVDDGGSAPFEAAVARHGTVSSVRRVGSREGRTLYELAWDSGADRLFAAVREVEATVLNAGATAATWEFELRFPSHDALGRFRTRCQEAGIPLDVGRVYNPAKLDGSAWYGLTEAQRRTLSAAVREGYYAIPRRISTRELGEEFGVSDQAVTERLRRAIVSLTEHTVLTVTTDGPPDDGVGHDPEPGTGPGSGAAP
ncbi:helix-turn-helix domain-containing protein [Halobaculum litoreum]|uniref:Helix-turn-helix domain-containing protein n=1 Tax=Halobaculum litoreum TaxID=3031998 RepID=A0ABD5XR78_9EURY|nr:helix-turn-helix domain-containing protein [Halobaculum sp. DT92]